jgi:hypothetical protein
MIEESTGESSTKGETSLRPANIGTEADHKEKRGKPGPGARTTVNDNDKRIADCSA